MAWGNGHSEDEGRETTGRFRIGEIRKANAKDNLLAVVAVVLTVATTVGGFAAWLLGRAEAPAASIRAELIAHIAEHRQEVVQLRSEVQASANRIESKVDKMADSVIRAMGRERRGASAAGVGGP